MSYNVVTQEGVRTFENIDDAGDYAQAMSLRTGEPAKVFHAETGLVAFTEVCADCMWRLKFSPVRTISLDAYRLFEQWRLSQSEADE